MTTQLSSKSETQYPPLARDLSGNLLAIPEGTRAWRICRETTGRPREIRGPDKQPIRFPLETTCEDLVELCGTGVYRVYALNEIGEPLGDEHVSKWDLSHGVRDLRNGAPEVLSLHATRLGTSAGAVTDMRFVLDAVTQMMRTNSEALRIVTDSHVDLAKTLATVKGLPRNAGSLSMTKSDEPDDDDDNEDEPDKRSPHFVELLMPVAQKLAEIVPGLVMGKVMQARMTSGIDPSPPEPAGKAPNEDDSQLATRPDWELRDIYNLSYAARKAQAKRAVREQQVASGAALAALQGRIMADPSLVERLSAIKGQLTADEIETLMRAIATSPDEERTRFLESIKALPVDGGVAFCRDVAVAIRESSSASAS